MPSSWLEDDDYEAWATEIELSEPQPQPQKSNTTSTTNTQAGAGRHGASASAGPQQSDRPSYASSYQPYSQSQFQPEADAKDDDPRQYHPPDALSHEQRQADTTQQDNSEVSDTAAVPGSANRQTGPSDIDSLFGDSASEAGIDVPLPQSQAQTQVQAQAQAQNNNQTQPQNTTPAGTPPPASSAAAVPGVQPAGGGGGGSLLGSLFADQGWDNESLSGYNPTLHRREGVPERWFEKQKKLPGEKDKEKEKERDKAKEGQAAKGPDRQAAQSTKTDDSAASDTDEGLSGNEGAAGEQSAGYDSFEDEYPTEEQYQYSYEEQAPYDSQTESDEQYPEEASIDTEEDFPEENSDTEGDFLKEEEGFSEEHDATEEQEDHPGTRNPDLESHPPEWYLADHHPWAYLRDAYDPDAPAANQDATDQPSGFAQYASGNAWQQPPRQLSPGEQFYARLLYIQKLKAQGRDPRDPTAPARDRSKSAAAAAAARETTESDEELEWVQGQMERRRAEDKQYLGRGGLRDQSLWSAERKREREEKLMEEVIGEMEERRQQRQKKNKKKMAKDGKGVVDDGVGNDAEGDDEECNCPCDGLASKCTCHPLYCPCPFCDHTEQAQQLRREAERKWGERQDQAESQQQQGEIPRNPGSCCCRGTPSTQCVCLPGLCSCDGREEHDVSQPAPSATSHSAGPWPQIPVSQRLFNLEQQVPSDEHACGCRAGGDCLCQPGRCSCNKAQSAPGPRTSSTQEYPPARDPCPCRAGGECRCQPGTCKCNKAQTAPEPRTRPKEVLPSPSFPRSAAWTPSHASRPLHLKLSEMIETPAAGSSTPLGIPRSVPPSRPDTPRPPADSTPSIPYAADVLQEYIQQSVEPELAAPEPNIAPRQSVEVETTPLTRDGIRQSVEPEYPPPNWERDTTPAYEDRSFTPSPLSQPGDVEMRDASGITIVPSSLSLGRAVSVPPPDANDQQQPPSPHRPVPPPIPDATTIQQPKRGEKKKSGVQSGKIDKRTATGPKTKPKSRNVTRKPTQSIGRLVEKAKKESKEAAAEEAAGDGPAALKTPTKPLPKAGGKVAEAVKKIEKQIQQQEDKDLKQKDGSPVRRSGRANKGVRTSLGYATP